MHTDHINDFPVNFTPSSKAYSVVKIHMSHFGIWRNYNNMTYHRRKCILCDLYEYQQHVPYYQNGVQKCSVCNATGPFQLIIE